MLDPIGLPVKNIIRAHTFYDQPRRTDNAAPGLDYAENYYAAFALEPDGINLEAM